MPLLYFAAVLREARPSQPRVLASFPDPIDPHSAQRLTATQTVTQLVTRREGELCFAFGSPLGEYTESVTYGVVSGLGGACRSRVGSPLKTCFRPMRRSIPVIRAGPLVGLDGDVLGINSSIRADGRGMGFAVPAKTAATIIPELIDNGEILRPKLGVSLEVIDHPENGIGDERLRVARVAKENTLETGDVLLGINGVQIRTRADLFDIMRRDLLDKDVVIEVERNGEATPVPARFLGKYDVSLAPIQVLSSPTCALTR